MEAASCQGLFEQLPADNALEPFRQLARSGHLENPIPGWFKEELTVALASSCRANYCASCERCLLRDEPLSAEQIAAIVRRRSSRTELIGVESVSQDSLPDPAAPWPEQGSPRAELVLAESLELFRQTEHSGKAARELERAFGSANSRCFWPGRASLTPGRMPYPKTLLRRVQCASTSLAGPKTLRGGAGSMPFTMRRGACLWRRRTITSSS